MSCGVHMRHIYQLCESVQSNSAKAKLVVVQPIGTMKRRPRIDLGQEVNAKEAAQFERKHKRWAQVNKNRPDSENPFLNAIKPDHDNYGEPDESADQLRARLEGLEFGNYPGYFNYRNKPAVLGDTDEWFRGKRVLDVGCNRGHITYAIAKLMAPQFILGIDIDLKMIHMANRDLHLHLEDGLLKDNDLFRLERACKLHSGLDEKGDHDRSQYLEDQDHMTLSSYVNVGPIANSIPDNNNQDDDKKATPPASKFPNNILFVEHNYVLAKDELVDKQAACFDTIICLSVTKWIHLNYRDEGLKRFLKRIYRHLKPQGLLVLEVQPFDNYYRNKRKLSDRLRSNYYNLKFKPEQIDEYLLSNEVGFKEMVFSTTTEHVSAGFKRPLKVFLK